MTLLVCLESHGNSMVTQHNDTTAIQQPVDSWKLIVDHIISIAVGNLSTTSRYSDTILAATIDCPGQVMNLSPVIVGQV